VVKRPRRCRGPLTVGFLFTLWREEMLGAFVGLRWHGVGMGRVESTRSTSRSKATDRSVRSTRAGVASLRRQPRRLSPHGVGRCMRTAGSSPACGGLGMTRVGDGGSDRSAEALRHPKAYSRFLARLRRARNDKSCGDAPPRYCCCCCCSWSMRFERGLVGRDWITSVGGSWRGGGASEGLTVTETLRALWASPLWTPRVGGTSA
jgi:hypothetical protein